MPAPSRALRPRPASDSAIVPPSTRSLFAYDMLLDERFVARLLERPVAGEPAELLDFRLLTPEGFAFAVLLAEPGARARGLLYRVLSDEDFARIDAYVGIGEELYFRDLARVTSPGGDDARTEEAWVYLPTGRTVAR
ncbi:MAG TPA: gamma-glutamylcyclotransferase family protein, partial [Thermoanaerobaculia bacterium]|nr:gamma-glutamylcyclotransferase family protein [Thermoanaerobaculia bacterium]